MGHNIMIVYRLFLRGFILLCFISTFSVIRVGQTIFRRTVLKEGIILDDSKIYKGNSTVEASWHQHRAYMDDPSESAPSCSREQIKDGLWHPVRLEKPPYISRTMHLRCYPIEHYYKPYYDSYEWKPSSGCVFQQWDKSEFCSLMKRATVLIIGDSLSWEHYSSLCKCLHMAYVLLLYNTISLAYRLFRIIPSHTMAAEPSLYLCMYLL